MSFLTAYFYDALMAESEEACLKEWRQRLLDQVHGDVLELGAGTGANLDQYPSGVQRLVMTEPDKHMRKQLSEKVEESNRTGVSIGVGSAEQIDAADESFDFVVATLVCCSVSDPKASLSEIRRVLRPGGGFVFLEHVAAEKGTARRRWQNTLNPLWKTLMGNCHLNRQTEELIVEGRLRDPGHRTREHAQSDARRPSDNSGYCKKSGVMSRSLVLKGRQSRSCPDRI